MHDNAYYSRTERFEELTWHGAAHWQTPIIIIFSSLWLVDMIEIKRKADAISVFTIRRRFTASPSCIVEWNWARWNIFVHRWAMRKRQMMYMTNGWVNGPAIMLTASSAAIFVSTASICSRTLLKFVSTEWGLWPWKQMKTSNCETLHEGNA